MKNIATEMLKLLLGLTAWPLHWSIDGRTGAASWRILPAYYGPLFAALFLMAVSGCELFLMAGVLWQLIFVGFLMLQRRPPRPAPAAAPA